MPTIIAKKKDWWTFLNHIEIMAETCEVQMTENKMTVHEPGWGNIASVESECAAKIKDPKPVAMEPRKMMQALLMIVSDDITVKWDDATITITGEHQYVKLVVPAYEPPKRRVPKLNAFFVEFSLPMEGIRRIMDLAAKMMHASQYSGILYTLKCTKADGVKMSIGNISVDKCESEHTISSPAGVKWMTGDEDQCMSQFGASFRKLMDAGDSAVVKLGQDYPIVMQVDVGAVKTTYILAHTKDDEEMSKMRGVREK